MKTKLLIPLLIFAFGFIVWYFISQPHKEVHYHAGFIVYVDGIKQDYSDFKYMNFTPCSDHKTKQSKEEEQIEKAHLHDGDGGVVHVHRPLARWSDLFKNIAVDLPNKNIAVYQDNSKISDNLDLAIIPNQSVIIIVGDTSGIDLTSPVPLSHLQEIEKKSELCSQD